MHLFVPISVVSARLSDLPRHMFIKMLVTISHLNREVILPIPACAGTDMTGSSFAVPLKQGRSHHGHMDPALQATEMACTSK